MPSIPSFPFRYRFSLGALAALSTVAVGLAAPVPARAAPVQWVAVSEDAGGRLSVHRVAAPSAGQAAAQIEMAFPEERVLAANPDMPARALDSGADPYRERQWNLDQVSFEQAWTHSDGAGTVVAVLDTGVDAAHEDLAGAVLDGWDALRDGPGGTTDPNGHGTHVAGTVAAVTGNGRGVTSAAPGAKILPVRVLDDDGSGWLSNILEGIVWAADHGADVINLSLGGVGGAESYRSTIQYATDRGVVVVAAAGNEGERGNPTLYPGADPGVITVAAVDRDLTRAPFSSHGSQVDLSAPGVAVVAPYRGSYASLSGTSMATPHVAAAAALLLARHPSLDPASVQELLERTADDLGSPGRDQDYGAGLVDPARAIEAAAAGDRV